MSHAGTPSQSAVGFFRVVPPRAACTGACSGSNAEENKKLRSRTDPRRSGHIDSSSAGCPMVTRVSPGARDKPQTELSA